MPPLPPLVHIVLPTPRLVTHSSHPTKSVPFAHALADTLYQLQCTLNAFCCTKFEALEWKPIGNVFTPQTLAHQGIVLLPIVVHAPQLLLLQVELPKSEHTVIRVSPSILMGELLCFICGKRNINPAHHRFDLPVTEESLAHRSLQQLKINSIKIIAKGEL